VRAHHEAHGGMSRFDKIPRYLEWAREAKVLEVNRAQHLKGQIDWVFRHAELDARARDFFRLGWSIVWLFTLGR